jgi:hypothetical protein
MTLPRLYKWDGGPLPSQWSFGWETGEDNDLICVKPCVNKKLEGELTLSPVCHGRVAAVFAFLLKVALIRIDTNITYLMHSRRGLVPPEQG